MDIMSLTAEVRRHAFLCSDVLLIYLGLIIVLRTNFISTYRAELALLNSGFIIVKLCFRKD